MPAAEVSIPDQIKETKPSVAVIQDVNKRTER